MPVKVETIGVNQVELEITVPKDTFARQLKKTAKKVSAQVNIPGFRKGKVPLPVLEARLGKEYILSETADDLMDAEYFNALTESGVSPVSRPEAEVVQLEAGEEFIYKVKFFVKPEIQPGEYKNLGVEHPEIKVTDDEVEAELLRRQRLHSKLVNIEEGTVEDGDIVTMDYAGALDGKVDEYATAEDYEFHVGVNKMFPGFGEQVLGMAIGEEKDIPVLFPADYRDVDLAGREMVFHVKTRGIKRTELLPLDDEFAKDVSEFDTLEEYREDLRRLLLENAELRGLELWRSTVLERAIANAAPFEIPPVMIEERVDAFIDQLEERLSERGFTIEDYFEYVNDKPEALRENFREPAVKSLRTELFLEEIARRENIQVSDQDLEAHLTPHFDEEVFDVKELVTSLRLHEEFDQLSANLAAIKALNFIFRANDCSPTEAEDAPEGYSGGAEDAPEGNSGGAEDAPEENLCGAEDAPEENPGGAEDAPESAEQTEGE
ncbi:MAG: trigger factor [Gracilibacteraceae bacterium]|nr:trigger factor [Gracilibacteraceae bacterium]